MMCKEKLDKVIAGLECCTERSCTKCPYLGQEMYCMAVLEKDALELLKVQKSMLEKASEVQKSGDLISRKALLSKMYPYGMPDNGNYGINARAVRDAVVGAKAVEVEPVVHAHNTCDHDSAFECSACGFSDWDTLTADCSRYNYCPHCGAHMDEEVSDGSAD